MLFILKWSPGKGFWKLQYSPTVSRASYQVINLLHYCFSNETSLFSKVKHKSDSATLLNSDLEIISKWAFQCIMLFNPEKNKQTIDICFSHRRKKKKKRKENYPPLIFNSASVQSAAG